MHNFFCPEFPAHICYLILHYQFQVGGKHGVTVGWSTIRADRAAPKLLPQTSLRTNLSLPVKSSAHGLDTQINWQAEKNFHRDTFLTQTHVHRDFRHKPFNTQTLYVEVRLTQELLTTKLLHKDLFHPDLLHKQM